MTRSGGQAHANGIADALVKKNSQGCRGGYDPLQAQSRFGQTNMQRILAALSESAVDLHNIFDFGGLGAEDDLVAGQTILLGHRS